MANHALQVLTQQLNVSINDLQRAQRNNLPSQIINAIQENITNLRKQIDSHKMLPPPPPLPLPLSEPQKN